MLKRALGLTLVFGVLLLGTFTAPAVAVESGEVPHYEYEDISGAASPVGEEFLPEEYSRPPFFDWIVFPLVAAGVLVTALVLLRYLMWQPRFSREAKEKSRR